MPIILNGKYELGRTLGRGVSCKVKIGRDNQGHRYAVKIMNRHEDSIDFLETEFDVLSSIPQHKNIVRLVEVGRGYQVHPHKGKKLVEYFVLELVGGGELFDLIALGGGLTEPLARHMLSELLSGLSHMHKSGFAHRDLKPENVLLSSNFELKITDFGFSAPLAGRDGSGLLKTQVGTLSFMAPEQHLGLSYEGSRADIFASGIILFTTIAQRPPFHAARRDDQLYCLLAKARFDLFWKLHAEAEDDGRDIFSPEFKDLFQRMMALDAAKRPTIEQILQHPWFQGPIIDEVSWRADFARRKEVVDAEAKRDRQQKQEARQQAQPALEGIVFRGIPGQDQGDQVQQLSLKEGYQALPVRSYGPLFQFSNTQFFSTCDPVDYFIALVELLSDTGTSYRVSSDKLKLKYQTMLGQANKQIDVHVEVLRATEQTCCVKFSYRDPATQADLYDSDTVCHFLGLRGHEKLRLFCDTTFDEELE